MADVYTLTAPAQFQEEIRKSRFLASAAPVETPEAALAFVAEVADPMATHNCWAYRLGSQYRYSDAGEPAGTAGRPILQAIEGQSCDGVVVVVTRWFGGVKLGTGGLVRAYGGCAAQCLRAAPKALWVELRRARLACTFAELPLFKARLVEIGMRLEGESFTEEGPVLDVAMPVADIAQAERLVADLSRGRARLEWQED